MNDKGLGLRYAGYRAYRSRVLCLRAARVHLDGPNSRSRVRGFLNELAEVRAFCSCKERAVC